MLELQMQEMAETILDLDTKVQVLVTLEVRPELLLIALIHHQLFFIVPLLQFSQVQEHPQLVKVKLVVLVIWWSMITLELNHG
jgi:hypothetical protein